MTLNKRLFTITCYAAFFALGIVGSLFGPTMADLTGQYGIQLKEGGAFPAAQFIGTTLGILIMGQLLDRMHVRRLLLIGTLFMGLGLLGIVGSATLPLALIATFLMGIGYGTYDVSINVAIAALNEERASIALNLVNFLFGVGAIVGPQLVTLTAQSGYRVPFILTAAFTLLLLIPFGLIKVNIRNEEHQANRLGISSALLMALAPFVVLLFLYVGSEVGLGTWIATEVKKVTMLGIQNAAAVDAAANNATSLFWGGLTVSRIVASFLLRRMSDEMLLVFSCVVVVLGVIPFLLWPGVASLAMIGAFIAGFGCGPIFPTAVAIVNNRYPQARGMVSSFLIGAGSFGAVILPPLQGLLGNNQNGGLSFSLVTALLMLMLSARLLLAKRNQTATAE